MKVYRFKSAKAGSGWGASQETAVVLSQCSWRGSSYDFRSDVWQHTWSISNQGSSPKPWRHGGPPCLTFASWSPAPAEVRMMQSGPGLQVSQSRHSPWMTVLALAVWLSSWPQGQEDTCQAVCHPEPIVGRCWVWRSGPVCRVSPLPHGHAVLSRAILQQNDRMFRSSCIYCSIYVTATATLSVGLPGTRSSQWGQE